MTGMPSPTETFIEEAQEQIEGLEGQLLDLEKVASPETIDAVFRALHTIKGSGSMFGFVELAAFTHHFEDAFDRVRDGLVVIGPDLINLSLRARDHMQALLAEGLNGGAKALSESPEARHLLEELARLVEREGTTAPRPAANQGAATQDAGRARRWHIHFKPNPVSLRNGMRPDLLLAELEELGRLVTLDIDASDLPPLDALDPLTSYLGWNVVLDTSETRSAIDAVFIFADSADLTITEQPPPHETPLARQGPSATEPGPKVDVPAKSTRQPASSDETIRVASGRLDAIVDQLGELVIAQARLESLSKTIGNGELDTLAEEMGRLVASLRDATLGIRMLPIETVFGKFRRVVRDLSADLGKDVLLVTDGGETEIDKNVIDRLTEPLVHLIRNSVDHGIEPTDQRLAAGKSRHGTVSLVAQRESGEVAIVISDDGGGLNLEAIRRKAIARGLLQEDADVPDAQLGNLIFAPGFSTSETVSKVSGRGVGMDAVKTAIEALRGKVEVVSNRGEGTRITLKLPVSMSIIDGLLVRIGSDIYVLPLSAIEECVDIATLDCSHDSGRTMVRIHDHLVPWLDLAEVFHGHGSGESDRRMVIVRADGLRLGVIVDEIIGQHQTVIKPFSPYHRTVEGLSGATILPDGAVALIIDVASLVRGGLASSRKAAA